jgi:hypothetical protein
LNDDEWQSFGSTPGGGFNEFSLAYKNDPSLEKYLEIRRKNPSAEIEVAVIGGIDKLFSIEAELRKFGFDPSIIASALDADSEAISEISLILMEKIIEARQLEAQGETQLVSRGLAVPQKLMDWLISLMLDALSWNDTLHIPRDLIVLIRERLGGSNPYYEQAARTHVMRNNALMIGGQMLARGLQPSFRSIAKLLEISPSTVKRWFDDRDFEKEVQDYAEFFNCDGTRRSPTELGAALFKK